jgi:hypothetical protein
MPAPEATAASGSFRLELAGQSNPVNSIQGGAAVGVVVNEPAGMGAFFHEKHLSGVSFEPIAIEAVFGSARPLFDWIATAWKGTRPQMNGALIAVDAQGRPVSRREFVNGLIAETTVPALDGSSTSPALMTVRVSPQRTSDVAPPASLPAAPRPPASLVSNFRLSITGLEATRVAKIDSFTVRQQMNLVEFPNLRIELSAASGATWRAWYKSFVIDGNSSAMNEKDGTLELLSPNLMTVFAKISFHNLGIFRLDDAPADASGGLARLVADLYCERMELTIP